MDNKKLEVFTPNDDFLEKLVRKKSSITVFVKNGVQLHGTAGHLYLNWMRLDSSSTQGGPVDEENYIRYDAISTIRVRKGR